MKFEELFAKLDKLLADKSNNFTEMLRLTSAVTLHA